MSTDLPTPNGHADVGEGSDARPREPALVLTGPQKALFDSLSEKSPELARMYLGAVVAVRNAANPERFAQAAHSMRELMQKVPEYYEVQTKAYRERLSDQISALQGKWEKLLRGTDCCRNSEWSGQIDNPLAKFLKSVREFFEWFVRHRPRRKDVIKSTLRAIDGSGRPLPPPLESLNVEKWEIIRDYFIGVCHHDGDAEEGEYGQYLGELERFLLDLVRPRTFDDFSEIDRLITEAEGDA